MTSDQAINPYDAVAYPGHSFAQTHPSRLATIAHFHGMQPAMPTAMRVLELGCGRGGNLIPMAAQYPQSRFLGIDLSGDSIRQANAGAAELELTNISFEQRDILAVGADIGRFDYIIVHGVYSWVPDPVRERIIGLFGELLAPQGVAYVSYNALPGCRFRDMARDVMLFETRDIADPRERVRVARATLKAYAEASDPESYHGAILRLREKQVEELPDNVLYHDDLNPIARAFTLHEVLGAAERHGLQFLAEASFPNMYGAAKGAAQQMLADIPLDQPLRREQALDLLIGRAFRETLLCRAELPLRRGVKADSLRPYWLAADVQPARESEEERKPGVDRFAFHEGVKLSVDLPVCKAALRILGEAWPANMAWPDLVRLSLDAVATEAGADFDRERETARLEEALIAIFKTGLLDVRLEPPPLTTVVAERPAASQVARWQASTSAEVTDLRHRTVLLDSVVVRKFVSLLDGSRDEGMLLEEMNRFLDETRAAGIVVPGLPDKATAAEVAMHLKDVARLGLLHG
ncbi:methyltransferase domain-containing protein [Bosea thiooxidans]|nr:methyltransferase regulatory domain-containing protein [Bosea sp. (in: a-proteobacteria)]